MDKPSKNAFQIAAEQAKDPTIIAQVYAVARAIPVGRVLSYGEVGKRCEPDVSGFLCGRIMNNALQDVPWWRVVGKDGNLPISKRNPHLAVEQRERLEEEGVAFENGCVVMSEFAWTGA